MSITGSTSLGAKRRKLSHSSDDLEKPVDGTIQNGDAASELSNTAVGPKKVLPRIDGLTSRGKSHPVSTTGGVTKASLMQLQVDELLEEIRPDYDHYTREIQSLRNRLIQTIDSIPRYSPLYLVEAEKILRKIDISIPFSIYRPDPDIQYWFENEPPDHVSVRGGITQHLCAADELDLEIALHMPSEVFQEKDYLNFRALHKRAYYLACVAARVREDFGNEFEVQYEFLNGDMQIPVISMKAISDNVTTSLRRAKISINVVLPHDLGSVEKMLPHKNCLRTFQSHSQNEPSPAYNSALRTLASTSEIDGLIQQAMQKCETFSDVCLLGSTWLRQRGFTSCLEQGGFGRFEWTYMCALLLTSGGHKGHPLFSDRYSSVQLFKAMLQVLATRDFFDPFLVRNQDLGLEKGNLPILFDGKCGINVLSKMSQWSYHTLRHHAQLSLAAVNDRAQESFVSTFITKVSEPSLEFDEIFTIDVSTVGLSEAKRADHLLPKLYDVLKRGFGDRVSYIDLRSRPKSAWKLSASGPKQSKDAHKIEVLLQVNPDAANRLIDHGPTAEQQEEAKEFRKFWGEKSELRRFRDGSITETLVWSSSSPVIMQILQYLLVHHFKILPSSVMSKTSDLRATRLVSAAPINAEDAFRLISKNYQELSSKLHQMTDLPLPIRSVSAAGQALRSASMEHPLDPVTSAPVDILIQFDSSARWPDNLLAIQHTKIAFLAKISDLVTASDSSITCRIGLENTDQLNQGFHNTSFLDIIYPTSGAGLSPMIFRLRIHHERELQLLQSQSSNAVMQPQNRELAASALLEHRRTFVAAPAHTNALRNLITHFVPLSYTIRLLKSWIAAHNLSNHVPDPILEIIASHIFLRPYPWSKPGNATTAFCRCLHFLANWDWTTSPLIVDLSLSQDMTNTQTKELETRYHAWRKLDPNMNTVGWFVGTSIDTTGTIWTQGPKPAKVVAGRVTALARAAIDLMKTKGLDMSDADWNSLFVSSTSDFDFVIHFKSSIVRGGNKLGKKGRETKFKNLQIQEDLDVDSIGYDSVSLFLEDLERAFASTALFFRGEGGKHIAGLWRPNVSGVKNWRVRLGYSSVPYPAHGGEQSDDVEAAALINTEGILTEIAQLGEGMIESISVKQ